MKLGLRYLRPVLPLVVFALVLSALGSALLVPISAVLKSVALALGHPATESTAALVRRSGLVLLAVLIAQSLLSAVQSTVLTRVTEAVGRSLRRDLLAHVLRLPMAFFRARSSGDILSAWSNDVGLLQIAVAKTFPDLVRDTTFMIVAVVILCRVDWQATLLAAGVIAAVALLASRVLRFFVGSSSHLQNLRASAMSQAGESIANAYIIKHLDRVDHVVGRIDAQMRLCYDFALRRSNSRLATLPLVNGVGLLFFACVVWLQVDKVLHGRLTGADFLTEAGLIAFFASSAGKVGAGITALRTTFAGMQRIETIFGTAPQTDHGLDLDALGAEQPIGTVALRDVSLTYDAQRGPVLDGVSLAIEAGSVYGLVGPSGAGKSTILELISGMIAPSAGEVLFGAWAAPLISRRSLSRRIGLLPQEPFVQSGTIRDNIAFGRLGAGPDEIAAAAAVAGLASYVATLPLGYDTPIGEGGTTLSRGQRQRVAIARVALQNPEILLLDEPTTGLDPESEREVWSALTNLFRGRTTVIVTHQVGLVRSADRIGVLLGGRIVEEGNHAELLRRNGVYAAYEALDRRMPLLTT